MAHKIEEHDTVLSTEGVEWHGLAKHVPVIDDATVEEHHLLFPIITGKPSILTEDGETIELESYQTILADIRQRGGEERYVPLHVPKSSYRPISNREIWECIKASIEDSGVKVTTAGTLNNMKRFFVSLDLNGKELTGPRKEKFSAFLSAMTSHDGSLCLEFKDSFIRIVCNNTFEATRFSGGRVINVAIPHTKNASVSINNMSDYLASVLADRKSVMEGMKYLHSLVVPGDEVDSVVSGYLTDEEADELSTNAYNRVQAVRELYKNGIGNKGETRYDLFNGFTEFFTHHDGAGGKKADKAERMSASRFGKAAFHKDQFLSLLMDEERYTATKERGAKLYHDKHLAMMK
jgi:phage/plasmid-like protein (TIGR03299 family)